VFKHPNASIVSESFGMEMLKVFDSMLGNIEEVSFPFINFYAAQSSMVITPVRIPERLGVNSSLFLTGLFPRMS